METLHINHSFLIDAIGALDSYEDILSVEHCRIRFWPQKCQKMSGLRRTLALIEHKLVFLPFFSNLEVPLR